MQIPFPQDRMIPCYNVIYTTDNNDFISCEETEENSIAAGQMQLSEMSNPVLIQVCLNNHKHMYQKRSNIITLLPCVMNKSSV